MGAIPTEDDKKREKDIGGEQEADACEKEWREQPGGGEAVGGVEGGGAAEERVERGQEDGAVD